MNAEHALELRTGWKADEDALLFEIADRARTEGKPLKSVFEEVASATGRRPNSIRNYYYARIKEDDERSKQLGQNAAFIPFTAEEIETLLRTVLREQAKGVSVRACTLAMGNGDNKQMLRYQNKYRSLIKNNPRLVKKIIEEMQTEGAEVFDPYRDHGIRRKAGRPRKTPAGLVETICRVVSDLNQVEGLDVTSFFESLGALAAGAIKGAEAKQMTGSAELHTEDALQMKTERNELKKKLTDLQLELAAQQERYASLIGQFRLLMNINRKFLHMTSVAKISSLADYIRELSHGIESCEKVMPEYPC